MKRKFIDHSEQEDQHDDNKSTVQTSRPSKHVKFSSSEPSASASSSSNHQHDHHQHDTDNSKFTMESLREAKSLRKISQLEGFENTTSILGQVDDEHKLEGEEGDLNQERFQDDSQLIEHFHLEKERSEGIFNDNQNKKKKKNKNHQVLKKVINDEDSFSDSDHDSLEKDEWADDLEEMIVKKNTKTDENIPEKEIPSMEECYEFIVNNLNDRKEKISMALERFKKHDLIIYNQLIKFVNILIANYSQYDIYDKKREFFQKQVKWFYKAKQDETIHGPFTTSEIIDWSQYLSDETLDGIRNNLEVNFNLFSSYDFTKFN